MKRSWLLIEYVLYLIKIKINRSIFSSIDHWDLHREVIVILMENHILIVRYNFIKERIIYTQIIRFDDIQSVTFGPCSYPDKSFMG